MDNFTKVQDFENHALSILKPSTRDYYAYGAGEGITLKQNREAFKRLRIRPRVLRNVSKRDISTTILGEKISMPVGVSPTAKQKLAHPDGESANARAAEAANTIFILSTYSNTTIQDVGKAAPNAVKWFQTTVLKDRDCILHCIRRAEQAGFKAIVMTVDNPIILKSKISKSNNASSDVRNAVYEDYFLTKTSGKGLDNFDQCVRQSIDDSLTWEAVGWIKSVTHLPIVLKGILTAEDAVLAANHGASAIIVSNHGARQLDGSPATIEALPDIVNAVQDKLEVYLDGGIRQGTDVFKALALGARMVFIGRPMLWGLACGGEEGVRAVLETMRREVSETFALTGCSNVQQVGKDSVVHESYYSYSHL
ncbi:peroxisomal (S)-2-hydroxy-acid oxidase-like [Nasonia vitripennis]|uniref:(S)-2-hydroxy-acid oxidase n=1 Tax=Nasonia vitripennis TaxID=7425 RepID=A0A7M7H4E8_NASVI|nr:peroxisomal (S)-2-hydroxy-acid oxidase-like [Nasonia vitripennis]